MIKTLIAGLILTLAYCGAFADSGYIQSKLMSIAAEEAQIANIGANKYMMLYGKDNPLPIINRWNQIEKRPTLTDNQIEQINALEAQKQAILKQAAN